jgi:hypothetical protein
MPQVIAASPVRIHQGCCRGGSSQGSGGRRPGRRASCRARATTPTWGRACGSGAGCSWHWRGRMSTTEQAIAEHRYGSPNPVQPRLGQGAFRLLVTDAYGRRCAVTGERTLPVLDAAHIRPIPSAADCGQRGRSGGLISECRAFREGSGGTSPLVEVHRARPWWDRRPVVRRHLITLPRPRPIPHRAIFAPATGLVEDEGAASRERSGDLGCRCRAAALPS